MPHRTRSGASLGEGRWVGDEDSDPSGGGETRNEGRWVVGPRGSRVAPRSSLGPVGPWGPALISNVPAPADGRRRRCNGRNIFPGAPASHRPQCVMFKMGALAPVAVGTFSRCSGIASPAACYSDTRIKSLGRVRGVVRITSTFCVSQAGSSPSRQRHFPLPVGHDHNPVNETLTLVHQRHY